MVHYFPVASWAGAGWSISSRRLLGVIFGVCVCVWSCRGHQDNTSVLSRRRFETWENWWLMMAGEFFRGSMEICTWESCNEFIEFYSPEKLTCPLKNSGWKMYMSFWDGPFFLGTCYFSGGSNRCQRVCMKDPWMIKNQKSRVREWARFCLHWIYKITSIDANMRGFKGLKISDIIVWSSVWLEIWS